MSVIQLMVTIIIVTILVTVILGVVSYGAYWLRRARRPVQTQEVDTGPRFFYRYEPAEAPAAERVEDDRPEEQAIEPRTPAVQASWSEVTADV